MVRIRAAVVLAAAAQAGVVAAQEVDEPVLIPPAPAAAEQGDADDAAAGPALVPPPAVNRSPGGEGPALGEPPASEKSEGVSEDSVVPATPADRAPERLPEADLDRPTGLDRLNSDDLIPAAPWRTRVPPARPTPPSFSEEQAEGSEVRIRQRGTGRREEVPSTDGRDAVSPIDGTDESPAADRRDEAADAEEAADEVADDVRLRYRLAGGEWWFLTRSGTWKYYRGGEWRDFDPVTFVPLRALQERAESGGSPYAALRPVSGEEGEIDEEPRMPPGSRLVPADAVDVRTGTYYGPGPEVYVEPVPDEGWGRRRPLRSMIRGFLGR